MVRVFAFVSLFKKALAATDMCSIYDTTVADGTCGEAMLDCQYVAPAKAFRNTLQDGHCADAGYSVASGSQTITVPVVGDITISLFKKALGATDMCSVYDTTVADGTCGEAQLDCQYVAPAKAFRNTLKDGHCADAGYSVASGSQTITVPVVGDITISLFKQAVFVSV